MSIRSGNRKARLQTIGRFRKKRATQRSVDLENRLSAVVDIAEDVSELVKDAQAYLAETHNDRMAMSRELHGELNSFKAELARETTKRLNEQKRDRKQTGREDRAERGRFMSDIRSEVERIVTVDFPFADADK